MNQSSRSTTYRIFDRFVDSQVPLQLLRETDAVPPGVNLFRIRLHDVVSQPGPDVMWEPGTLGFHMVRETDGFSMVFQQLGWFARLTEGSNDVELFPMSRSEAPYASPTIQALGDRLVTSLLSRFPQSWGMVTIHGALLSKNGRSIALLGPSGAGKSTLSQVFHREHGWEIFDDDTFGLYPDSLVKKVWPMGAYPRIWDSSLEFFEATGTKLSGYQGGKIFVPDTPPSLLSVLSDGIQLSQVFDLCPLQKESADLFDTPELKAISAVEAIQAIARRVMFLDESLEDFSRKSFQAVTSLSSIPAATLSYVHNKNQPREIVEMALAAIDCGPSASSLI